ncbi:MAG: ankyrin repeat domain-containing protein [Puniceicoccales bacterium]|jgi:ankyrin repeat protein|nr:ankyrin repeat domain-containing protein [Puniceicoccales bacterium]
MNKNYNIKNKFLKNIALGGFLFGGFAGTFPQLQVAASIHSKASQGDVPWVRQLLNGGVDPNKKDNSGQTPLHFANTPEVIDLLYSQGANPNATDNLGNTPLHTKVRALLETEYRKEKMQSLLSCIERLLQKGANKNKRNHAGYSPESTVGQALLTGFYQNRSINKDVREAYTEAQRLFSQFRAKSLHEVVADDDIEEARRLLDEEGADPNGIDQYGDTPLHWAQTPEIIRLLLDSGANIDHPNRSGDTPLRIAVADRHPKLECIKELLRQGANKDIKYARDGRNKTPIEAIRIAIESGIVEDCSSGSIDIDDDARLKYAKVLPLFFLPQHLWPRLNFDN